MSRAHQRIAVLSEQLAPSDALSPEGLVQQACSGAAFDFEPGKLLKGQVAIITGSGQGIGRAAALLFAQHGCKVTVSDLDGAKADAVAEEIKKAGGEAIAVAGDVTDPAFPKKVVDATISAFKALHILVNNAGFTWDGVVHKMPDDQFETMFQVHCLAPFRLIREAAPHMRGAAIAEMDELGEPRPRAIINVSSVSGTHGSAGQINYSTAKSGLLGMTKTLAREWGPYNIRANVVAFGYIQTRLTAAKEDGASIAYKGKEVKLGIPGSAEQAEMAKMLIALNRLGSPEEAAASFLLLASPYASYISGQLLEVTGGGWI